MALGDLYVSLDEFKEYMKMTGKDQYDDALSDALSSSTAEIDRKCRRQFNRAETATVRSYYPTSRQVAKVHDFYTTEDLVITLNGSALTADQDYELQPLDGIVDGSPGWPFWIIKLLGGRSYGSSGSAGAPLKVTARWGWTAVPSPVKQACLIMAAETFQLKDAPLGVAGMDAFGSALRVRENRMADGKLRPYIRDPYLVG